MRGGVLLAALSGAPGCLSYLHPVDPPPPELAGLCRSVPKSSRDHVYVFLVHGMDPLNYANLSGVRDYVQSLGFNKTYYGQLYDTIQFDKQIHRIRNQDPEAHFVLIGFSFGANMVRDLAQWAKDDGISIDLLVYLGGNTLENTPEDKPANVKQIVNILASGCIWNGCLHGWGHQYARNECLALRFADPQADARGTIGTARQSGGGASVQTRRLARLAGAPRRADSAASDEPRGSEACRRGLPEASLPDADAGSGTSSRGL